MKDLNYYYEHAISINDFLEKYYGRIDFRDKKLIHENIKTLFPDIKRGSFEDIVKNLGITENAYGNDMNNMITSTNNLVQALVAA